MLLHKQSQSKNTGHFKKLDVKEATITMIAEESEQPSSSITPIGASSKGATPYED